MLRTEPLRTPLCSGSTKVGSCPANQRKRNVQGRQAVRQTVVDALLDILDAWLLREKVKLLDDLSLEIRGCGRRCKHMQWRACSELADEIFLDGSCELNVGLRSPPRVDTSHAIKVGIALHGDRGRRKVPLHVG